MAILQTALTEPLLSRRQVAVIRNIACAAQIAESLKQLSIIEKEIHAADQMALPSGELASNLLSIREYLKAEASRVLMQIKIPVTSTGDSKATQAPE